MATPTPAAGEIDQYENMSIGGASTLGRRSNPRSFGSSTMPAHLSASTMSMRAKSLRKRKANRQHNSNFSAGYVPVDEEVLHRSGIRGRKRYLLWSLLVVLLVVALLNALISVWLVYILGLTHEGVTSLEFSTTRQADRELLRVLTDADVTSLVTSGLGCLGGRAGGDLVMASAGNEISMTSGKSSVTLTGHGMTFTSDDIKVNDTSSSNNSSMTSLLPHPELMSHLHPHSHSNMTKLTATGIVADRILALSQEAGSTDGELRVDSTVGEVKVQGQKGVEVSSGKQIDLRASNVVLDAEEITLHAKEGIKVDVTTLTKNSGNPLDAAAALPGGSQYKVCVCATGRVFLVAAKPGAPMPQSCDLGREKIDDICNNDSVSTG